MKNIAILGSSGSIGTQALNIIRRYPDRFKVTAIVANNNLDLVYKQYLEFKPEFVGFSDESVYSKAKDIFNNATLVCGKSALTTAAALSNVDVVVAAVVGMCGLESVIEAAKNRKDIALANKESLVAGGEIVMPLIKQNKVNLIPVDSEHSAVWQCLKEDKKLLKRIILTASGGMFYGKTREELKNITVEQATKHLNWNMGKKITVDCSTMMNKGLEIIEARWLFDTFDIDYIIHRESLIHSMIEYVDGSILAQISNPNMEYAIQLALTYPERLETFLPNFNFEKNITFNAPDEKTFILPSLAKQAMKKGGTAPCILNSANEAAVNLFLSGKIGFSDIQDIVEKSVINADIKYSPSLTDIIEAHNYYYNKLMTDYKN